MRSLLLAILFLWAASPIWAEDGEETSAEAIRIRVMSFNLWRGGDAGRQPLEKSVEVIRASRADVVGLQETRGIAAKGARTDRAKEIADMLGWHYFNQGANTGIVSRHEIVGATPNKWGVVIELPGGRRFYMFNTHFAPSPYQPYQLLDIPYGGAPFIKTEAEAIEAARKARGSQVDRLLGEVRVAMMGDSPVLLTGDFNEPSCLDWTSEAAKAGRCPLKVQFPASRLMLDAGMVDTYREIWPDPVARPGWTWTPTTKSDDPKDKHDRIDFVLAGKRSVRVVSSEVVGESETNADVVVKPYPSDHRAVVSSVDLVWPPSGR